ncbi:MAG: hypothetical protein ACI4O5_06425, partial [Oscillospiraceae bacterium]
MKKLLALLLALAMVLSLAACSGGGNQAETPSDNPSDSGNNIINDTGDIVQTDYVYPEINMVEKNDFLTLDPFINSA